MARPAGARNQDFDEKRAALLDKLTEFALNASLTRPSLRQFAIAAGQSEPTLRHYFGDRQGLVIDIIHNISKRSQPIWEAVSAPSSDPGTALSEYIDFAEKGMREGRFTRAHAFGLIEGFADEAVGKVYLAEMLEPSLAAFSYKLRASGAKSHDEATLRAASLVATAPLLVFGVHQELLDGKSTMPFDIDATFDFIKSCLSESFSVKLSS